MKGMSQPGAPPSNQHHMHLGGKNQGTEGGRMEKKKEGGRKNRSEEVKMSKSALTVLGSRGSTRTFLFLLADSVSVSSSVRP